MSFYPLKYEKSIKILSQRVDSRQFRLKMRRPSVCVCSFPSIFHHLPPPPPPTQHCQTDSNKCVCLCKPLCYVYSGTIFIVLLLLHPRQAYQKPRAQFSPLWEGGEWVVSPPLSPSPFTRIVYVYNGRYFCWLFAVQIANTHSSAELPYFFRIFFFSRFVFWWLEWMFFSPGFRFACLPSMSIYSIYVGFGEQWNAKARKNVGELSLPCND